MNILLANKRGSISELMNEVFKDQHYLEIKPIHSEALGCQKDFQVLPVKEAIHYIEELCSRQRNSFIVHIDGQLSSEPLIFPGGIIFSVEESPSKLLVSLCQQLFDTPSLSLAMLILRSQPSSEQMLLDEKKEFIWKSLNLNTGSHIVSWEGCPIELTPKQFEILALLLRNGHHVVSYDEFLSTLWPLDDMPTRDTLKTHIKGLRDRLSKAGTPDLIKTVRGIGCQLESF